MLKKYVNVIQEQEPWELIEKMNETIKTSRKIHYIPDHPIQKKPSITTNRIVYNSRKRKRLQF